MPRGGKRKGAGRKPKAITEAKLQQIHGLITPAVRAAIIREILESDNLKIKWELVKFQVEQTEGKAPQKVKLEGADDSVKVVLIGAATQ